MIPIRGTRARILKMGSAFKHPNAENRYRCTQVEPREDVFLHKNNGLVLNFRICLDQRTVDAGTVPVVSLPGGPAQRKAQESLPELEEHRLL